MLDLISTLLQGFILIKIAFLILNGFYVVFLLIVFKQAHAMQNVINDQGSSSLIDTVALFNIIVGICLFVAALVIL